MCGNNSNKDHLEDEHIFPSIVFTLENKMTLKKMMQEKLHNTKTNAKPSAPVDG